MPGPIWKNQTFWLMVADAVFVLATYFLGKYGGLAADDWLKITAVLQPVIIYVIHCVTKVSVETIKATAPPLPGGFV